MKRNNSFIAYIFIGLGIYFLLQQFNIPILNNFYAWPTIVIIIGVSLLLHSFSNQDYEALFSGTIMLGVGIHFHGLKNYPNWINHWAIYLLIIGIAFFVRYLKTKKGFLTGIILIGIALLFIFPIKITQLEWIKSTEVIWPLAIILIGVYLLRKK